MILRRAGGGDVPAVAAVNLTVLEPGGGRAIDEIDPACDIAVAEKVAPVVDHKRVLPADDSAIDKDLAVTVNPQRQRLSMIARDVFDGEMKRLEVARANLQSRVEAVVAGRNGIAHVAVPGENGCRRIVALERDVGHVFRNEKW